MKTNSEASGSTIVLTGGSGFLGQNVINYLAARGIRGVALDIRKPSDPRVNDIFNSGSWEFHQCDFSSAESLRGFAPPKGPVYLVHLAGRVTTTNALTPNVVSEVREQVHGLFTLLNHLGPTLKGIAFTSTIETYGYPETLPIQETHPTNPFNIYSALKLTMEHCLTIHCKRNGIPLAILRIAHIYGPRNTHMTAIPTFIKNCLQRKPSSLLNKGEAVREFVHVDDAALAVSLAATQMADGIFNIAGGRPASIAETLEIIQRTCGTAIPPDMILSDKRELMYSFDLSKAQRELGYTPAVPFEDGLQLLVEWLKGAAL